jgi:hypothetical protein
MQYYKIAKKDGIEFSFNKPLIIEPFGIEIINKYSNWLKYLEHQQKQQELKDKRDSEAHEANLKSSEAAVKSESHARNSIIIAAISTMIAIVALYVSYNQYKESNDVNTKYDLVIQEIRLLQQHQSQTHHNKLDSLPSHKKIKK